MIAGASIWQTDRSRLIGLVGAGLAMVVLLLKLGFFFNPGFDDVLGGLAHHAFVLGCMLLLTSGSRTVSLGTLGVFWLLGVWGVYGVAYFFENQLVTIFGAKVDDEFVSVWLAPFVEETTKLLPVAIFLLLAGRSGFRHPSISDGMLLGFMIGAGVSFQEDAHFGKILVSGDGWGAATPWTTVFPTISPLDSYFALNHALWAALSGISIGAAVMLRHWRWTWPIALVGPVLSFTNHLMANQYTHNAYGLQALLNRAKGNHVPWFYDTIRDLTAGGRLPMLALIGGAIAVVIIELSILRWVGKRDRMFPPIRLGRIFGLITQSTSTAGAAKLMAADRYLRLRNCVYYAGWQTKLSGGSPGVTDADYDQLILLAARNALPSPATRPEAALATDAPSTPNV